MASPNTLIRQDKENEGKHLVHVLHKMHNPEVDHQTGLAVGKTFKFPSGAAYTVQSNGSVVNAKPKTWLCKADRKAIKRAIVARRNEVKS